MTAYIAGSLKMECFVAEVHIYFPTVRSMWVIG